jgi:hypothetical protein
MRDSLCIFTQLDGKEKWTAYKFTRSVYDVFMPRTQTEVGSEGN